MSHFPNKNYFTMPNEIFSLGLDASEIAVYAYLRCLESRSTYQCWPSYCCKADSAAGIKQGTSVCMRKLYHRHRWTRIAYGKCARKTDNYREILHILFIAG